MPLPGAAPRAAGPCRHRPRAAWSCRRIDDELLGKHRDRDGGTDRTQVVEGAAEPVRLAQDRDRRRAARLVCAGARATMSSDDAAIRPADGEERLISAIGWSPGGQPLDDRSRAGGAGESASVGTDSARRRRRRRAAISATTLVGGPDCGPVDGVRSCRCARRGVGGGLRPQCSRLGRRRLGRDPFRAQPSRSSAVSPASMVRAARSMPSSSWST